MIKKINSQKDLDALLALTDWQDAFFREGYILSPSYVDLDANGIVAWGSAPIQAILICTLDKTCPGIEFFFEELKAFYFSYKTDLNPTGRFEKDRIFFSFNSDDCEMQSKSLSYRILDTVCWVKKFRYGIDNVFDDSGSDTYNNFIKE